jgi:hypothetical protein
MFNGVVFSDTNIVCFMQVQKVESRLTCVRVLYASSKNSTLS